MEMLFNREAAIAFSYQEMGIIDSEVAPPHGALSNNDNSSHGSITYGTGEAVDTSQTDKDLQAAISRG